MSALNPDHPSPGKAIRLAYGPEPLQFGELYVPGSPGPHPTVILIHGGYWRARYKLDLMDGLAEDLAGRGIAAWNIEYRRVGDVGGGWPATLNDVLRATQFIEQIARSYAIDLDRVAVAGHSAGGHLALWAAAQDKTPFCRAISLAGVTDLKRAFELHLGAGATEQFLGGAPDEVPDRYGATSPIELLPIRAPQLLIHGTSDDVVPIELSDRFGAVSKNCELVRLEGADHFDVIDPRSPYWPVVMARLKIAG